LLLGQLLLGCHLCLSAGPGEKSGLMDKRMDGVNEDESAISVYACMGRMPCLLSGGQ
jgi:hypothetical protein